MIVYFQINDRLFSAKLTTILPPLIPRVPFYFQSKDHIFPPRWSRLDLIVYVWSNVSSLQRLFPMFFSCIQPTSYVSIIQILFPIHVFDSNVRCIFPILYTFFPSWIYVSKLQCFQCMFPINIAPYFRLVMVWVRSSNVYRCGKSLCES